MKLLYLIPALFMVLILSACSKNSPTTDHVNTTILPGVWELRAGSGGMLPYNPDNYKPGNGNLWAFSQTNFATARNHTVVESGTYSISMGTGTDLNTGRKIDQFILNNVQSQSFELRNDTLKIYYGAIAADGIIEMYVKVTDDTSLTKF